MRNLLHHGVSLEGLDHMFAGRYTENDIDDIDGYINSLNFSLKDNSVLRSEIMVYLSDKVGLSNNMIAKILNVSSSTIYSEQALIKEYKEMKQKKG